MIALDTNVLVRYLVRDDVEQAESARILLEGLSSVEPGFICREVAIELVWVLERSYGLTRAQIVILMIGLMAADSIVIEAADDVGGALRRYGDGGADFADLMILAATRRVGAFHLRTFDRRLARENGALLVEA